MTDPAPVRAAHPGRGGRPAVLALLLAALLLAPLVRGTTADIGRELGGVWPFVLTHCHVGTTPGCARPAPVAVLATR